MAEPDSAALIGRPATAATTGSTAAVAEEPGAEAVAMAARSSAALLRSLLPFLAPYRGRFIIAGLALLIAALATLAVPQLIDLGFTAGDLTRGSANVNLYFIALFLVSIVLALGTAVRFFFVS